MEVYKLGMLLILLFLKGMCYYACHLRHESISDPEPETGSDFNYHVKNTTVCLGKMGFQ